MVFDGNDSKYNYRVALALMLHEMQQFMVRAMHCKFIRLNDKYLIEIR